jgi:hypothetical protein
MLLLLLFGGYLHLMMSPFSLLSSSLYLKCYGHCCVDYEPRDWVMVSLLFTKILVDDALELELCIALCCRF